MPLHTSSAGGVRKSDSFKGGEVETLTHSQTGAVTGGAWERDYDWGKKRVLQFCSVSRETMSEVKVTKFNIY